MVLLNPLGVVGMAEQGTCAFCGFGQGYLGEQGDETTQYLNSVVRRGEAPDWQYETHENAWGNGNYVTWCGNCLGGLKHKFQRYDDTNLRALYLSSKMRLELDGLRWFIWEADDEEKDVARRYKDDPAIHLDKLRLERSITDMENEQFRRAGFDLTTRGWRP